MTWLYALRHALCSVLRQHVTLFHTALRLPTGLHLLVLRRRGRRCNKVSVCAYTLVQSTGFPFVLQ